MSRRYLVYSCNDGNENGEDGMPSGYWDVLRESRHEVIDVSYWHSLGRGDVYADAMSTLQFIIMDYTVQLYEERMNENENKIAIQLPLGEAPPILLLHDAKLLSRWKMLFYAMVGSKGWKSLTINSIEMPKVLMDELAKKLKVKSESDCSQYSITFNNNNFGRGGDQDGSCSIPQIIQEGIYLQSISITNNIINSKVASNLSTVIANHAHLKDVELSGSGLGNNTTRNLSSILSSCHSICLEELFLNNINLQARGITVISDFLASDPQLHGLTLDSNELNDNAAISFAASLSTNSRLRLLSLAENNFSDVAYEVFATAIFDDSSLNALIDCNHTCTVTGISDEITNLQCSKETKKFRAIWSKGKETGLRHHLYDDLSLEEMPKMLSWIQHVPRDVCNPLYLMFEVIRSHWELPLLFSGRHQPEEVKLCLRDMVSIVSNVECSQSFHQALLLPRKTGEYDTILPKTQRGFLINIGQYDQDRYEQNSTAVFSYRRYEDGSKGLTELFSGLQLGDVVTAINGRSTIGKSFIETFAMVKSSGNFLYARLESRMSFLNRCLIEAQAKYNNARRVSDRLLEHRGEVETKYIKLAESHIAIKIKASDRMKRLHARERAKMKIVFQGVNDKFRLAEKHRAMAKRRLAKMECLNSRSHEECRCGHLTRFCKTCKWNIQAKKQRIN